jgi:hypothetical protein
MFLLFAHVGFPFSPCHVVVHMRFLQEAKQMLGAIFSNFPTSKTLSQGLFYYINTK